MTAGKGFIALAALIFAKWRPVAGAGRLPAVRLPRCAVGIRFQSIDCPASRVPVQFIQALPYILTVVLLAGFVGKAIRGRRRRTLARRRWPSAERSSEPVARRFLDLHAGPALPTVIILAGSRPGTRRPAAAP